MAGNRRWPDIAARTFGEIRTNVDMTETDKQIRVMMELPGMDDENVEVLLSEDRLTVKEETRIKTAGKDHHLFERSYGSCQRSFSLPPELDADKVKAAFAMGVLTITLPKRVVAGKPVKKIAIGKTAAKEPAAEKRAAKKPAAGKSACRNVA
jgi:HSP20 family protein